MRIKFPGIAQADLDYAVECIEVCRQENAEQYGFPYPYFTPGGAYGAQWWQLDSSLALCGYKWVDRAFCERSLLNFVNSQRPDGRICLWGKDLLPSGVAGGDFLQQTENVSSLPKLFDSAYHILQGSTDREYKEKIYGMLKRYLDWWFAARLDVETGLMTSVFEETFIPYLGRAGEYAAVDTNVEVCVGCHYVGLLAAELGRAEDVALQASRKNALRQSINRYLWWEEKGAYYPYLIKEKKHFDCLMASTFYPLRLGIATQERRARLLELMTSDVHFNWDTIPLTSVAKTDPAFVTTEGRYKGNASWSGNVWTLINETAVRGLCDCGEDALAAELALKTLRAFNHNCAEFVNPFDGRGHGVEQYAWSASQYVELLVETVFGVSYSAADRTLHIAPRLTEELKGERIELLDLPLASGLRADVTVDHGRVECTVNSDSVNINIKG